MTKTGGIESTKLKSCIERIENLEEQKSGIASDIKDVFAGSKSNGFDVKAIFGHGIGARRGGLIKRGCSD